MSSVVLGPDSIRNIKTPTRFIYSGDTDSWAWSCILGQMRRDLTLSTWHKVGGGDMPDDVGATVFDEIMEVALGARFRS